MQKAPSFTIQCWGLFFWISKKWKSSFLFFCQQGFELCSPKFGNLWNSSFMSQISSLMLLMMIAIMMIMITMMVMLIMITIKIMNVEHIWLISLDAMWIKISFAVACDFNQLVFVNLCWVYLANITWCNVNQNFLCCSMWFRSAGIWQLMLSIFG